jgi:hypothetical protein
MVAQDTHRSSDDIDALVKAIKASAKRSLQTHYDFMHRQWQALTIDGLVFDLLTGLISGDFQSAAEELPEAEFRLRVIGANNTIKDIAHGDEITWKWTIMKLRKEGLKDPFRSLRFLTASIYCDAHRRAQGHNPLFDSSKINELIDVLEVSGGVILALGISLVARVPDLTTEQVKRLIDLADRRKEVSSDALDAIVTHSPKTDETTLLLVEAALKIPVDSGYGFHYADGWESFPALFRSSYITSDQITALVGKIKDIPARNSRAQRFLIRDLVRSGALEVAWKADHAEPDETTRQFLDGMSVEQLPRAFVALWVREHPDLREALLPEVDLRLDALTPAAPPEGKVF